MCTITREHRSKHTTMPTVSASTGHSNALAAPTMQTLRDGHNRLNIAWAAWRSSAEDARFAAKTARAVFFNFGR